MENPTAVLAQAFHIDNSAENCFPRGNARFLRLSEVRRRVPYGRASIYRLIAAGQFPRPYSLGARAVAWLESDIDAWIETRVKAGQAVPK